MSKRQLETRGDALAAAWGEQLRAAMLGDWQGPRCWCKGDPACAAVPDGVLASVGGCQLGWRELAVTLADGVWCLSCVDGAVAPGIARTTREAGDDDEGALRFWGKHGGHGGLVTGAPTLGLLRQSLRDWIAGGLRMRWVMVEEYGTGRGVREAWEHPHGHVLAFGHLCVLEMMRLKWALRYGNAWGGRFIPSTHPIAETLGVYEAKHVGKQQAWGDRTIWSGRESNAGRPWRWF